MIAVKLTRGFEAIIDDQDLALASSRSWQVKIGGLTNYAIYVRRRGTAVEHLSLHRLILGAEVGQVVDHRDGNGLNNTRANLRICTSRENAANRAAYIAKKRAAGGFLGVYKLGASWVARIHAGPMQADGQRKAISLKCHAKPEDAARVYDSAAAHYFGEFAALNFPDEPPRPFDLNTVLGTSRLKGSIEARANGTFLVRAPGTRKTLGTFRTRQEADEALLNFPENAHLRTINLIRRRL